MFYYFIANFQDVYEREEEVDLKEFPQFYPLTDEQVEYHLAHPEAKRWEIEHHNDPIPEPTLDDVKRNKISEIDEYDVSSAVNEFFIGNQALWLDKATRTGLNFSLIMEEEAGRTESTLWYNNICFTLPIALFKQMLQRLEIYAKDCYNITAQHKVEVENIETKEEVIAYDITAGYPEKLTFMLPE